MTRGRNKTMMRKSKQQESTPRIYQQSTPRIYQQSTPKIYQHFSLFCLDTHCQRERGPLKKKFLFSRNEKDMAITRSASEKDNVAEVLPCPKCLLVIASGLARINFSVTVPLHAIPIPRHTKSIIRWSGPKKEQPGDY